MMKFEQNMLLIAAMTFAVASVSFIAAMPAEAAKGDCGVGGVVSERAKAGEEGEFASEAAKEFGRDWGRGTAEGASQCRQND